MRNCGHRWSMSARRAHHKHSKDAWTIDITWLPDSQRYPGKFNKKSRHHIDCDVILHRGDKSSISWHSHTIPISSFEWSIKRVQLLNSERTSRTVNIMIALYETEVAVRIRTIKVNLDGRRTIDRYPQPVAELRIGHPGL